MQELGKDKKIKQPVYSKDEMITLLQKVQNDFVMLDKKIKEILNVENMSVVDRRLIDAIYILNECAEIRNKKIEELIKMILR